MRRCAARARREATAAGELGRRARSWTAQRVESLAVLRRWSLGCRGRDARRLLTIREFAIGLGRWASGRRRVERDVEFKLSFFFFLPLLQGQDADLIPSAADTQSHQS
jgi:hypothetical protein